MKKLDNGYLYTRDEFRERVEGGLFIDSDGEGQYSNEDGDWTSKWLSPSYMMKIIARIWNIHI